MMQRLFCPLALLAVLMSSSSELAVAQSTAPQKPLDERIRSHIHDALVVNPRVDSANVTITVNSAATVI